ncbi:uncharacterized protein VP01_940g6, partial [Puccinia sorghi]
MVFKVPIAQFVQKEINPIKKHLHPRNIPPCPRKLPLNPQKRLLRSQPSKESQRKTEVMIHLKMMMLTTAGQLKKQDYLVIIEWLKIERNYDSCFGTGKACAVVHPAK